MCLEQRCARTTLPSAPAWKYLLMAYDLTSAGLCVTAVGIALTCSPAFYPESFSSLYKRVALRCRFITYTIIYVVPIIFL